MENCYIGRPDRTLTEEERSEEEESIFASNIVLFDPKHAKPVRSALFRIDWKRPTAQEDGNGYWEAKS